MPDVALRRWAAGDLALLRALVGDPAMMAHLGGPEPEAKIVERQARYEAEPRCLCVEADGTGVGWVGYWDSDWQDAPVYEAGWSVVPAHWGRGIASAAVTLMLAAAGERREHDAVLAVPDADNAASNAVCRRAGFELLGAHDLEYPPGTARVCNVWRYGL